jgi:hypothetical protein
MIPVMTTSGKPDPEAETDVFAEFSFCSLLQRLVGRACLLIASQYLSRALVRGRGVKFRHEYHKMDKKSGKDFRDAAIVPHDGW